VYITEGCSRVLTFEEVHCFTDTNLPDETCPGCMRRDERSRPLRFRWVETTQLCHAGRLLRCRACEARLMSPCHLVVHPGSKVGVRVHLIRDVRVEVVVPLCEFLRIKHSVICTTTPPEFRMRQDLITMTLVQNGILLRAIRSGEISVAHFFVAMHEIHGRKTSELNR